MGAGLPFLIVSFLAIFVLLLWAKNGKDASKTRIMISASFLTIITICWVLLLTFGVFHPLGGSAMLVGFIGSIIAIFVPTIINMFSDHH